MTLQELKNLVTDIDGKSTTLFQKSGRLMTLVSKVKRIANRENDGISQALTQSEVDSVVNTYTPLYIQALTDIETAADALGTDPLH